MLPLSWNQEGALMLASTVTRQVVPMHVGRAFLVDDVDAESLQGALNDILTRHHVLRTSIRPERSRADAALSTSASSSTIRPVGVPAFTQSLDDVREMPLRIERANGQSDRDVDDLCRRIVFEETRRPFDLGAAPLIRAALVTARARRSLFLVVAHHLAADRFSLDIIERELDAAYRRQLCRAPSHEGTDGTQYADFAAWQRQELETGALRPSVDYWLHRWREYGDSQLTFSCFPDGATSRAFAVNAAEQSIAIDDAAVAEVRRFARQQATTVFIVVLAALFAALHVATRRTRMAIWTHLANRTRVPHQRIVGWLANSHMLGVDCPSDISFDGFLTHVRTVTLEAVRHQAVPAAYVWRRLQDSADSKTRFLADMWVSCDFVAHQDAGRNGRIFERTPLPRSTIVPGMQFTVADRGDCLSLDVVYSAARCNKDAVTRLLASARTAVHLMIANPNARLSSLALENQA